MTLREHVKQMLDLHPDWTNRDIAETIGCSKRSVRRYANPYRRVETKTAKILLFDIETAPMEVYTWSLWPKSISYDNVIKDFDIQ